MKQPEPAPPGIKARPQDFQVEEIPAHPPDGEGAHLWVRFRKEDLNTADVVAALARHLGVREPAAGVAGLKDKRAVTVQWASFEGAAAADLAGFRMPGVEILETARHSGKLRRGQLLGNRFRILVRGLEGSSLEAARGRFLALAAAGIPNLFGAQRFGRDGRNAVQGRALATGDAAGFLDALCAPAPGDPPLAARAREMLRDGCAREAAAAFPPSFVVERHLARCLGRPDVDLSLAIRGIPHRVRGLLVSAWQAAAFNAALEARRPAGFAPVAGDVLMFRTGRTCFRIGPEDLDHARRRHGQGEVVPAGPLPGWKLPPASHDAARIEAPALEAAGLRLLSAALLPKKAARGARRPYTVPVLEASLPPSSEGLLLSFTLPAGSFATTLLAEIGLPDSGAPSV